MKKILITNGYLKQFTGSELTVLDLAKEFLIRGYEVTVGTFEFEEPLKKYFLELNVKIINLSNEIPEKFYDIIWSHHFTTIDRLILDYEVESDHIIYSSLSPYLALESPPLYVDKLSIITANSHENKLKLLEMEIEENKIFLLENPVKETFFTDYQLNIDRIQKIAVVSSHMPKEIQDLHKLFLSNNIKIDYFGIKNKFVYVTPELLINYDLVITIGRTVQYSLALGIPVFCYDRFGGPGYINLSNISSAGFYNFSGRCTRSKYTSQELFHMINNEFSNTLKQVSDLKKIARKKYSLTDSVDEILEKLDNSIMIYKLNSCNLNILKRQRQYQDTVKNQIKHVLKYVIFKIKTRLNIKTV